MKLANPAEPVIQLHSALIRTSCSTDILLCEAGWLPPSKPSLDTKGEAMENITRKNGRHLRVPVLPEEEEAIKANAKATGLTVAAYLRNVGMGYQPGSAFDHEAVNELAKVNADLGRLGGLLKLWLTNDEKLAIYDRVQMKETIRGVLDKIGEVQEELLGKVRNL